jgi:hypothetical protein
MRRALKYAVLLPVGVVALAMLAFEVMRPPPPPYRANDPVRADPLASLEFPALLARLRDDAERGRDADLASHSDLIEAIQQHGMNVGEETRVERAKEIEGPLSTKWQRGIPWAMVAAYLERGVDADRLRAVYLSYERYGEWANERRMRVVERSGRDVTVAVDGEEKILGMTIGAKWRYVARPIERGRARIIVCRMVPAPDSEHIVDSRGLMVAFPEGDGVHFVEASVSIVDNGLRTLPAAVEAFLTRRSSSDIRSRTDGLRHHGRDVPQSALAGASEPAK